MVKKKKFMYKKMFFCFGCFFSTMPRHRKLRDKEQDGESEETAKRSRVAEKLTWENWCWAPRYAIDKKLITMKRQLERIDKTIAKIDRTPFVGLENFKATSFAVVPVTDWDVIQKKTGITSLDGCPALKEFNSFKVAKAMTTLFSNVHAFQGLAVDGEKVVRVACLCHIKPGREPFFFDVREPEPYVVRGACVRRELLDALVSLDAYFETSAIDAIEYLSFKRLADEQLCDTIQRSLST